MRRILPVSLTGRLITTAVALVAVVSILVAATATLAMRSYLTGRLDDQISSSVERAQAEQRDPGGFGDRAGVPPRGKGVPLPLGQSSGTITAVLGDDQRGLLITDAGEPHVLSSTVLAALNDIEADGRAHTVDLPALGRYRVVAATDEDGVLVGGLPTDGVDSTIGSMIGWEVLLAVVGTGLAAAVGRIVVRRQLRSLRDVAATAHEVTNLPLSSGEVGRTVRVPTGLTDPTTEVGQVGEALNRLLGHVEQALDARHESEQQARRFLADASHELRTPLSTIKGYAELSRRTEEHDAARLGLTLEKVEAEAARMSSLVEDMLLLARLDTGRPLGREPVDLTRLVMEAVDDVRVVDPERRWRLDLAADPVVVLGDEQRLHQAVTNLLTNATRHTPPGTVVSVGLRADGARANVEVHDDGPGVPPELQATIFERFTRGDSSRTRASGGAGLGMSLVQAIAQAHGGEASVTSTPGDTTFTVSLPTAS